MSDVYVQASEPEHADGIGILCLAQQQLLCAEAAAGQVGANVVRWGQTIW